MCRCVVDHLSPAFSLQGADEAISRRDLGTSLFRSILGLQLVSSEPALARGRSTQVGAWGRYGSRVEATRAWLAGDLRGIISSSDFETLKAATGKKGIVGSYLSALDLWAASYSDANPSVKTIKMQAEVEKIRMASAKLNVLAKKATGDDLKKEGGLFGFGAKEEEVPTGASMTKALQSVRQEAVDAYNSYCVLNNEGHPFEVDELLEI